MDSDTDTNGSINGSISNGAILAYQHLKVKHPEQLIQADSRRFGSSLRSMVFDQSLEYAWRTAVAADPANHEPVVRVVYSERRDAW